MTEPKSMPFYRTSTQFYEGGGSTGGGTTPVYFQSLEVALKDIKEWMSKYISSIDVEKPKITKCRDWTYYKWQGSFEAYTKITSLVTLSYDHTQLKELTDGNTSEKPSPVL